MASDDQTRGVEADPLGLLGSTLAERLRVEAWIGRRAGGDAYSARDLLLDRAVGLLCVEVPKGADLGAQAAFFARFAEVEAALQGAAPHPGRVGVLAGGADRERGFAFLVLEGVSGATLPQWLAARRAAGPFGPLDVLGLLLPLAEVLADSHAAHVVHGRLEPSCVVVHDTGNGPLPYLLGHGIAAALAAADPAAAYEPAYGSPEHLNGAAIGVATDVHGFGRILVEAMLGRPLLDPSAAPEELARALRSHVPLTPASVGFSVPPGLEALCERALAPEPSQRFADGNDLYRAMKGLIPPSPVHPPLEAPTAKRPSLALLLFAGLFTVLSTLAPFFYGAYVGYTTSRPSPPPTPPPSLPASPGSRSATLVYADVSLLSPEPAPLELLASGDRVWHWRVTATAGRVDFLELVSPGGRVRRTVKVGRLAGTTDVELRYEDAWGKLEHIDLWSGDHWSRATAAGAIGLDGCAARRATLIDDRATELRCLDLAGAPARDEAGCEVLKHQFDAEGRVVSRRCFEASGAPRRDAAGVHETRSSYGGSGRRLARQTHHDFAGAEVADAEGCHSVAYERDAGGGLLAVRCAERSRRPAELFAWSDEHCIVRHSFVDADQRPVVRFGFATHELTRDERCGVTGEAWLDPGGRPARRGDLPPERRFTLDERGRKVEEGCLDRGKAIRCSSRGTATVRRFTYDSLGRLTSVRGFAEDGRPVTAPEDPHEARLTYDDSGRGVRVDYLNALGAPATLPGGAAWLELEWGVTGLLERVQALDPAELPVGVRACLGGVCWPAGAARLELRRAPAVNVFFDRSGAVLESRDCRLAACFEWP